MPVDDERDVAAGKVAKQRPGGVEGAVLRVVDAEHDLPLRIILLGERPQVFVEAGLVAVQRLQHRDRRLRCGDRGNGAGRSA